VADILGCPTLLISYKSISKPVNKLERTLASTCTNGLWKANFSHLYYSIIQQGCKAISGNFVGSARNCLSSILDYIVMQISKANRDNVHSGGLQLLRTGGHL